MREFADQSPALQDCPWPNVSRFSEFDDDVAEFLKLPASEQYLRLRNLRSDPRSHGKLIHRVLGQVYAYRFGYHDSPCFLRDDDRLELTLERTKLIVERELMDEWLQPVEPPAAQSQKSVSSYLREFVLTNPGVEHPLFDYLANEASEHAMRIFLLNDVIRNEIVDDEVAMLVCGHQGLLKSAAAINLFDECGRGQLQHFHTYWLRRLLEVIGWDELLAYRDSQRPWFAGITSNVFAMLLTRPPYKSAGYGHFIVTEGWVPPHFEKILSGLERTGLRNEDTAIYFSAHVTLDPTHTEELIRGIEVQVPELEPHQCSQLLRGAHIAVDGATRMYDLMLKYLRDIDGAHHQVESTQASWPVRSAT